MLHLITDPADTTPWYPMWLRSIQYGLSTLGVAHELRPDLPGAPLGPVVLTRYTLYDLLDALPDDAAAVVVEHMARHTFSGAYGGENPVPYAHPRVQLALAVTPSLARVIRTRIAPPHACPVVPLGFPYRSPALSHAALYRSNHAVHSGLPSGIPAGRVRCIAVASASAALSTSHALATSARVVLGWLIWLFLLCSTGCNELLPYNSIRAAESEYKGFWGNLWAIHGTGRNW
jgi:hypothetical protein